MPRNTLIQMPCSLCHNNGHNRRSATCPVNIAARNARRPPAELRPRQTSRSIMQQALAGTTGPTYRTEPTDRTVHYPHSPHTEVPPHIQLNTYMLLYKNMRPERQFEDQHGFSYNVYRILIIPGQPAIPQLYIRSEDNKVILRRVVSAHFTAIAVRDGNNMSILDNSRLPDTNELYVFIPQIPGFNVPITEEDVSARTVFENHITQMIYEINNDDKMPDSIYPDENTCVLCLETKDPLHFVRTNCCHSYCVACMSIYIQTQHTKFINMSYIPNNTIELPCPLCRTNITRLVFADKEQHSAMTIFMN